MFIINHSIFSGLQATDVSLDERVTALEESTGGSSGNGQLSTCLLLHSFDSVYYFKNNYRRESIRIANGQPKSIIFCKSCPSNCI